MRTLNNKIDFAMILRVKNANPNGDPLNGNRPRTDYEGLGEITDVCLKRKIRDRLVERFDALPNSEQVGQAVYVQSDDRRAKGDNAKSLKERAAPILGKMQMKDQVVTDACRTWIDVRAFGQLFPFKPGKSDSKNDKKDEGGRTESDSGVSVGIRGPVTIQSAFSVEKVSITSNQITKSVNLEATKDGKKGSDTMGMKHRVDKRADGEGFVYATFGSMNPHLAERTGFSDTDADTIKAILPKLFENDASSARPEGSMEVLKVIWWKHSSKAGQYSSAKVHRSLHVNPDGSSKLENLPDLSPEEIDGF
ncbi:MAG TPA: type I-C CRISPR-associated protein Cas7/Csd2 [Fibrobacteria bacterium]|nr:type I-C CRISPR-associated protein Cas7/Csd2 [Fibrobacteria bacterium]